MKSNTGVSRCTSLVSGFRAIERVMEVDHTTVIEWVKLAKTKLPDSPEPQQIPEVALAR